LAAEVGLCENLVVDLSVREGKLVIQRHGEQSRWLEDLLRGVTAENLHGQWDTGPAVGEEVW
jgi:antitoxin MazE